MYKFVGSLIGLLLMVVVASWQLFLFTVLKDASGLSIEGGRLHLGLAAAAGISACLAGSLMAYFFSRYEINKWSKVQMTPTGPLLSAIRKRRSIGRLPQLPFDPARWALANPWLTEGQADDRMPMDGSVSESGDSPSGQRAFARQTHQSMFKKWSQARHD